MFLFRHCSRRPFPLIPCGIVLLNRRSEVVGLARSLSQPSLFVSVTVTRGGGLNVEAELIWPLCRLEPRIPVKTVESAYSPLLCFRLGNIVPLADEVSTCATGALSKKPVCIKVWVKWSSGPSPVQGLKSAYAVGGAFVDPVLEESALPEPLSTRYLGAAGGTSTVYGFGRMSFLTGAGAGAVTSFLASGTTKRVRRLGMGRGLLSLSAVGAPLEVWGLLISPRSETSPDMLGAAGREEVKDLNGSRGPALVGDSMKPECVMPWFDSSKRSRDPPLRGVPYCVWVALLFWLLGSAAKSAVMLLLLLVLLALLFRMGEEGMYWDERVR